MIHRTSTWARVFATASLILTLSTDAVAQGRDGPYVSRDADGKWLARSVEHDGSTLEVREEHVASGDEIIVPQVGEMPAFRVRLRDAAEVADDDVSLPASAPLFVIADTHGEFEIVVGLLRRHGIVDGALRWSFGSGHLAILGDVFDRGPNHTELLWLIYELEAQAARAGGAIHLVLGNHEALVLSGDERYLHPKYVRTAQALKAPRYAALWDEKALLGQWLRTKPAVLKLGSYLCLHGGISRAVVDRRLKIAEINGVVRAALRPNERESQEAPADLVSFVMGQDGPLWYRGYFVDQAREGGFTLATAADVDVIRDAYDVDRILVGHTRVPAITPLYDGRVIAVQVYPHRDQASGTPVMEALLIRQGRLFRARADGSVEPLMRQR